MVVMGKATAPDLPSVNASVQRARLFYGRCKAGAYYKHSHDVLKLARKAGIVEGPVILDSKESMKRRRANHILAELCLYHPVYSGNLSSASIGLPPALRDPEVLHELEVFNELTRLNRSGAPRDQYISILNNGKKPPLSLLTMLVDYAVTHTTEERLDGLIADEHGSRSLFRSYPSRTHAINSMRAEARAGEKIYAPLAEFFGYPGVAGTIMNHAYMINHPEIHAKVVCAMADEVFQARLAMTQRLVRQIARHIKAVLKIHKFDADVTLRLNKSQGKIMRKVSRKLKDDFQELRDAEMLAAEACHRLDQIANGAEHTPMPEDPADLTERSLEQYIRSAVSGFDFQRLNDWVAARVVVKRHNGNVVEEDDHSYSIVRAIIEQAIDLQYKILGCLSVRHEQKRGVYRADHYDVASIPGTMDLIHTPLNFELQVRTKKGHNAAEHGDAAHHLYIGGDAEFMKIVEEAYRDIVHEILRGNGNNGNGNKR